MALVIQRKDGQTIMIGDNVEIRVYSAGRRTRVVIDAPSEVQIKRGELVAADNHKMKGV